MAKHVGEIGVEFQELGHGGVDGWGRDAGAEMALAKIRDDVVPKLLEGSTWFDDVRPQHRWL